MDPADSHSVPPDVGEAATVDADERARNRPNIEDITVESEYEERLARLLAGPSEPGHDELATLVRELEPADAADALEEFDAHDAAGVVVRMPEDDAALDIAEMQTDWAVEIIEQILVDYGARTVAIYIERMPNDDAVDILQALDPEHARQVTDELSPASAVALEQLMVFDPDTAGGMMTHEFVRVDNQLKVSEAIDVVRDHPAVDFTQIYCVDEHWRLVGIVSPRQLLVAQPDEPITNLIDEESVDYLRPDTDQEEIAAIFERYDYHEMPVVDRAGRLLGVITVDDVLDVIREEHTEDAYKMVGAGRTEAVYSGLWVKFRGRFPWLMVNVFTSLVAAVIVLQFDDLIAELAILAVLMPVIANQAGNAGQQSLAVTMRGLVLGEIRGNRSWPLVRREVLVGLLNGLLVGSLVGLIIVLMSISGWRDFPWQLGLVVAFAMTVSVAAGCLVGSAMPLILHHLKHDPATASTIFLTMVTDSVSFIAFLGLARTLQSLLIPGTGT